MSEKFPPLKFDNHEAGNGTLVAEDWGSYQQAIITVGPDAEGHTAWLSIAEAEQLAAWLTHWASEQRATQSLAGLMGGD